MFISYSIFIVALLCFNPNSLDNKGSWRILKDFYCSVTMLRELGLIKTMFSLFKKVFLKGRYNIWNLTNQVLPFRKNLLGSKCKAINYYFAFILQVF